MSAISFSGLASGLDSASLIQQLVELRRTPITRLEARKKGYQTEISALATLKTKLIALQDAAKKLDTAGEFAALKATSSDEDILRVSASGNAAPGTYDIVVNTLASGQKSVSQGYDDDSTGVGAGTVTFTVGGAETVLEVEAGASLGDLAEQINSEIEGVHASILFDGNETGGYHLVLTGDAGTGNTFTVDTSQLSGGVRPEFTQAQAATDATLTVDGMPVTGSGNSLDGVISGLTLDLRHADPGTTVRVEITMDATGVSDQVKGLVDAYNSLFSYLTAETGKGGDLEGNASARSVASRVESVMSASSDGSGRFTLLAQVGIERNRDRTLEYDPEEFADALDESYSAVRDLFVGRDGVEGKTTRLSNLVDDLTDTVDGLFKLGTDSLNRRIESSEDTITRYERSLDNYKTTLEKKFIAMESQLSMLQAQSSYLSSMTYYGS